MGNNKSAYQIACDEADKIVEMEVGAFKVLTPNRKITKLSSFIKEYVKSQKLIAKAQGNNEMMLSGEYGELLSSTRARMFSSVMSEEEKWMFVSHLKETYDKSLKVSESDELLKIYDYLTSACTLLSMSFSPELDAEISYIRESCEFVINKAYGTINENER